MPKLATPGVQDVLAALRPGTPITSGPLTVVPLLGPDLPCSELLTVGQALRRAVVTVNELDSPSVHSLKVTVSTKTPVFFPEGLVLLGGQQDRVVNVPTLAARGVTELAVSCVERGRWHVRRTRTFKPASAFAAPAVRAAKVASLVGAVSANVQQSVWDRVEDELARAGAVTTSRTLVAAQRARHGPVEEALAPFAGLARARRDSPVGLLALAGARVIAVDVFATRHLLARQAKPLLRSYAHAALEAAPATEREASYVAGGFLARLADATERREAELCCLNGDSLVGVARLAGRSPVHVVVFRW